MTAAATDFDARLVAALPMLGRYALRLTRSGADADDLVQAAALQMLERRERFTPGDNGAASFRGWAARVLYNRFISDTRRQRTRRVVACGTAIHWPSVATPTQERGLENADMLRALRALPQHYRAALIARALHGDARSNRTDGVGGLALRSRIWRARAKLQAAFDGRTG